MLKDIQLKLLKIRQKKPLVLSLTNYVSMDFMANSLLALGAAPIMSVCDEELEELIRISDSININLGTIDGIFIQRCYKAVALARKYKKPVILDPVGAGASRIRTETASTLLQSIDIVRGNASEIISLYNDEGKTRGVDSIHATNEAKRASRQLAKKYGCVIVVSGVVDFITDGNQEAEVGFGSYMMPLVTGMGCTLTAVIAAFRGISEISFESALAATRYFGLCGNITQSITSSPGTFRTLFIDALHSADFHNMSKLMLKGEYA